MKIRLEEKDLIVGLEGQVIVIPQDRIIAELLRVYSGYDKEDISGFLDEGKFVHILSNMPLFDNEIDLLKHLLARSDNLLEFLALTIGSMELQMMIGVNPLLALGKVIHDDKVKRSN